jgi:hypothetical protein
VNRSRVAKEALEAFIAQQLMGRRMIWVMSP